eukprot:4348269-Pyramimonas_sp.AAC.1
MTATLPAPLQLGRACPPTSGFWRTNEIDKKHIQKESNIVETSSQDYSFCLCLNFPPVQGHARLNPTSPPTGTAGQTAQPGGGGHDNPTDLHDEKVHSSDDATVIGAKTA